MGKRLIVGLVFCGFLVSGMGALATEFHVSPTGSDKNSGKAKKPFASLSRAQTAAHEAKGGTVVIHAGTYYLPATLVFTPEDSGTEYRAAGDGTVVISGGTKLELSWTPYNNGIMQAKTPAGIVIDQLFVNGKRQIMARYPNYDAKVRPYGGVAKDAISPERAARWSDPTGGFVHALHGAAWGGVHYRITGKDATNAVSLEGGWQNNRGSGMHALCRYVENVFEELDAPGEWYHNAKTSTLYYYPTEDVDLSKATVECTRLKHLIEFNGTQQQPVRKVVLKGLTFRHAERTFMDTKEPLLRSDWMIYRGGAVFFRGAEDCSIVDCEFDQLGGNAVFVSGYNRRIRIEGCDIHDTGASSVAFVGEPKAVRNPLFAYRQNEVYEKLDKTPGPKTDDYPADCVVENCLLRGIGVVEKQAAGVQISMASGITVRHCSIYDASRAGINIGDGCWGGHVIEFCDVFDTVKETGDHGSFNSWGRDRYWATWQGPVRPIDELPKLALLDSVKPTILRNSRWRCDNGWDVDLDDGSSNYEIYNNVFLKGGLKLREGFYRRAWNNISVTYKIHPHHPNTLHLACWYSKDQQGISEDEVLRNIWMAPYATAFMCQGKWGKVLDYNLFCGLSSEKLKSYQSLHGSDTNSLVGDPMFIDPVNGDYRVQKDSPALKLGFKNFPMDQFGVQKPELKKIARTPELPEVKAIVAPPVAAAGVPKPEDVCYWQGATIRDISGQEFSAFGVSKESGGVHLKLVPTESTAARSGFKTDDLVQSLNGKAVKCIADLLKLQKEAAGQPIVIAIVRGQQPQNISLATLSWRGESIDIWHGYKRHNFTVPGFGAAWVVEPKNARPGNPWTWCMEYPQFFTERTGVLQLLDKGFYHIHIAVANPLGSPASLKIFDAFYAAVVEKGLASKGTLIGLSRGGLYAYNWAVKNPDKVVCIYGDSPVCDFKSWPGGQGKGERNNIDWQWLLKCYGFKDEAEALAWKGNPVDNLEPLAKAGIPLIHVVGDKDNAVPVAENTAIIEERYKALKGEITVFHKPNTGHHPHGLDDPQPVVDLILRYSDAQTPAKVEKKPVESHPVKTVETTHASELDWPAVKRAETRPWTWWWWHGCAVSKEDITSNLEALQKSGIGGVNIVCLLDVKDDQAKKLTYLSPEWREAVVHAVHEARRLGMDADMSPVPGWAFGGPWVPREESSANVEVKYWSIPDQLGQNAAPLSPNDLKVLDAVVVVSADGKAVDLTKETRETAATNLVNKAIEGRYYAVLTRRGSSGVRMPPPDCRGPVVDHLSATAVRNYLGRFDQAFKGLKDRDLPRAYNNDSWEIHLNWTPGLLGEFAKRRGYDLRQHMPAFMGQGPEDEVLRVACDYRNTVSDLMIDEFTSTFSKWASSHGGRITGEVQDEPGNELDINALYDIPQADLGGPRNWFIKNGDYATDHFIRRCKIPASAAHILGKPLVSSETLSCMGPILDTPLEDVKEKIDYDLVAGVNHTMFHGITYSPAHARWPGWLFYAGTHLGPFNPMWRQGANLCDYVTRCQSFLQAGAPDADVLVYFPVFDLWSKRRAGGNPSSPGTVRMDNAGPSAAAKLWRAGHDFDFTSDRLLEPVKVSGGCLVAPGASYRALVVSDCRLMPAESLERIVKLAHDGATVILHGKLPVDVPGLGNLEKRQARFRAALAEIEKAKNGADKGGVAAFGKGRIVFGDDIIALMSASGIRREQMTDSGLRYVRRKDKQGATYFIANPADNKRIDGWIPLSTGGKSAVIFDAMTGRSGVAEFRKDGEDCSSVRLQIEPRESRIVRVLDKKVSGQEWSYMKPAGEPVKLSGQWEVTFLEGGETIPHAETINDLVSWTEWKSDQSEALRMFSGVACYKFKFQSPKDTADVWMLDLGEVRHTARVRLNGKVLGDLVSRPMRLMTDSLVKDGENLLEIEVANAPINRAADLDIRGIPWLKTMGEDAHTFIIGDFLFPWKKKDSSWVPRPSGLLGPVQLVPMVKEQKKSGALAGSAWAADSIAAVESAVPKDMKLFLLIGQSNMAGRGRVEEQDKVTHPRIFMLTKDMKWVPAKDPVHYDNPGAGVGLCSTFARVLASNDTTMTIGLIPCAAGGTPLSSWMPGGQAHSLFSNAVIRTKEAMKSGTLAGILWHQGESDAGKPELVASYAERFKTMIVQLRKELDAQNVPVIVGELGVYNGASDTVPFNKVIHGIPDIVPNCAWVSAKDLRCILHFVNAAGYRTLGLRYAETYLDLKGKMKE